MVSNARGLGNLGLVWRPPRKLFSSNDPQKRIFIPIYSEFLHPILFIVRKNTHAAIPSADCNAYTGTKLRSSCLQSISIRILSHPVLNATLTVFLFLRKPNWVGGRIFSILGANLVCNILQKTFRAGFWTTMPRYWAGYLLSPPL